MYNLKVALCQVDSVGGDVKLNTQLIIQDIERAIQEGAELIVFPELAISGYGADDFFLQPPFLDLCESALAEISKYSTEHTIILVGYPEKSLEGTYSSVAILSRGKVIARHRKSVIPNLELYTEHRYFVAYNRQTVIEFKGIKVGVIISEELFRQSAIPDCDIICCCAAFPWAKELSLEREQYLSYLAKEKNASIICVNNTGFSNSLLIEGCSSIVNEKGKMLLLLRHFDRDFMVTCLAALQDMPPIHRQPMDEHLELYWGIKTVMKQFIMRTSQKKALILMDGGLNSKLILFIAMKALGVDRVAGLVIQSRWDSPHLKARSEKFTHSLGVKLYSWHLGNELMDGFISQGEHLLDESWKIETYDRFKAAAFTSVAGLLNAWPISNIDKTQMALNVKDDIASFDLLGLMPLSDIYHTTAVELAELINKMGDHIIFSQFLLNEAKSLTMTCPFVNDGRETRVSVIDTILQLHLEKHLSVKQILAKGYDETLVLSVIKRLYKERKSRVQAGFSPKLSSRSFQHDWLFPSVVDWDDIDFKSL